MHTAVDPLYVVSDLAFDVHPAIYALWRGREVRIALNDLSRV